MKQKSHKLANRFTTSCFSKCLFSFYAFHINV